MTEAFIILAFLAFGFSVFFFIRYLSHRNDPAYTGPSSGFFAILSVIVMLTFLMMAALTFRINVIQ